MEQAVESDVRAVFQSLPEDGKKLLISLSHASHKSGVKIDVIKATSGLDGEKLEQALSQLRANNLVQLGKLENREFISTEDGDRFRLPKDVRKSVLSDVVGLDNRQVEELLKF